MKKDIILSLIVKKFKECSSGFLNTALKKTKVLKNLLILILMKVVYVASCLAF